MAEFFKYIEEFNGVSIAIRLVLATLLGGIIGMERESKRHSAGFRTFTLVCLSSALCTIANIYLWEITGSADTSRIPAGVISGIGFLGVGTIIITRKNQVRGLTTAAGLLATASLGIALGAGMITASIGSFLLIMLTMSILRKLSWHIAGHNRVMTVYAELGKEGDIQHLRDYIKEMGYSIISFEKKKDAAVIVEIDLKEKKLHSDVLHDLSEVSGIKYLEEA